MKLALVGMSGTGKTYWSRHLEKIGFKRYSCDELIAAELEILTLGGVTDFDSMAKWLGFPFETDYSENAATYLALEEQVLAALIDELSDTNSEELENVVFDTTGSVLYLDSGLLDLLQELTTVVHLTTPPIVREKLLQRYITKPRPILWGDHYKPLPDEDPYEALNRCYNELLSRRERGYAKIARVTIDYDQRNHKGFGPAELVAEVERQLQ